MGKENLNDADNLGMEMSKAIVKRVAQAFDLSKSMQILLCHDMGLSGEECAVIANASIGYVYNVVRERKLKPKLKERYAQLLMELPDWYRNIKRNQLPILAEAEGKALEKYLKDPELLIKHPALARQMRIAGGVAEPESQPIQVQINLAMLQGQQEEALEAAYNIKKVEEIVYDEDES